MWLFIKSRTLRKPYRCISRINYHENRWFLCIAAYLCGFVVFVEFCFEYKSYNSPRYELEVDYLHWTSSLPAFSFCQANFTTGFRATQVDRFLNNLVRPRTAYCLGCDSPHSEHFPVHNYTHIISKLQVVESQQSVTDYSQVHEHMSQFWSYRFWGDRDRMLSSCKELFSRCKWNGEDFDCCERFLPVLTGKAKCFTLNSEMALAEHKYVVSYFAKDAELDVVLNAPVQVFMHDPKDVDFVNTTSPVVRDNYTLQVLYSSKELKEDQTAWILTERQRGCALKRERVLENHPFFYSKSACRAEKRIKRQMKLCNCTHHLLPNYEDRPECDLGGLQCLDAHFVGNRVKNSRQGKKKKTNDYCLHACEEVEINVVWSSLRRSQEPGGARVLMKLSTPPRERLTLKSRVDNLDILIGVACFTRLFTSKSIMGILTKLLLHYYHHNRVECVTYRHILY